jgi:hypothetical protein
MSRTGQIECFKCGWVLPPEAFNTPRETVCPACAAAHQVTAFPALYRPPEPAATGEHLLVDGESGCFYHPQKKAVIPCDGCGRFLCPLCEVEFAGRRLCPACIQAGKEKKKIKNLENQRMLYDDLALSLAIVPLVTVYLTFIGAPVALYLAIRHWNTPSSIIPRTKWRNVLAILISGAEICGWALGIYFIIFRLRR